MEMDETRCDVYSFFPCLLLLICDPEFIMFRMARMDAMR